MTEVMRQTIIVKRGDMVVSIGEATLVWNEEEDTFRGGIGMPRKTEEQPETVEADVEDVYQMMREALADLAHQQWSGWMRHMLDKCHDDEEGNVVIPRGYALALARQMGTPYAELTEEEKDADRAEADKFLELIGVKELVEMDRQELLDIIGHQEEGSDSC
jgi:hypothetical protein